MVGGDGDRGSLVIDFEVDFPSRLREAHLAALQVVLTEEEIALLEDVLKLMSTRKVRRRCWRCRQGVRAWLVVVFSLS